MVTSRIDIIIPVYNAYDELTNCVDSVLSTVDLPHQIILIDDCSPDDRIQEYFAQLASLHDPRLILLSNKQNLGFVRTVNRGMALGQSDVVLLNSDTIVTVRWLEKLIQCARSKENIGTITPFSNNAEICSFPNFCEDNELSNPLDIEEINQAIEAAAVPRYPIIPTAVGFCMYIRRVLLDEIGLFDSQTFRLGYGEENDFCRRAVQAGWQNVLCDDTFIAHVGSSSFSTTKQELATENLQKLLEKHPDYQAVVSAFIQADPIKPIRNLAETYVTLNGVLKKVPGILHIMHGSSGGTEQHIRSLMKSEAVHTPPGKPFHSDRTYRHYLLSAVDDRWTLTDANYINDVTYTFERHSDELWSDFLNKICATFNINFCHVHHTATCRLGILAACAGLDIPYGVSVHDHFLACPTINMLDDSGFYCSAETDLDKCQKCLAKQEDFTGVNIRKWREENAVFIDGAKMIIGPSLWAVDTLKKYFSTPESHVIPHGVDAPSKSVELPGVLDLPQDNRVNIGILGAIGPVKGARQLELLVKQTRIRKLPIRWVVIGYTDTQYEQYQSDDGVLCVHGSYESRQMQVLLDHYQIKLVVFPSSGPETYCYTLTEAWLAGIPALVPPIGALYERVMETGAGWIMKGWKDADVILDDLLEITADCNQNEFSQKRKLSSDVELSSTHDMFVATTDVYRNLVSSTDKVKAVGIEKTALLEALQSKAESFTEPVSSRIALIVPTTPWGRFSLYFRHTFLGKLSAMVLPVRLKEILKRWMIGEAH